jgi:3-oxoacyl-(acyl-carrier-protein) synthase
MGRPSIVVTGLGIVSALGAGVETFWARLCAGERGLGPLTRFRSSRNGHVPVGEVRVDPAALGAPATGSWGDRLAFAAVREALEGACLLGDTAAPLRARAGIVLGATVGGLPDSERFLEALLRREPELPSLLRHHEIASSADLCAKRFGLLGPCATVSTACSSGAMAVAFAADLVESGETVAAVAVGADALCRLTLCGFGSLLLLDPAGCRPFDAARAGMSLGEGAAALVLEEESAVRRRGAPVLARLAGWGRSCDAHHMTAPDPDGRGAAEAVRAALARAGADPRDVGYVHAHGTGTRDNDVAEARALRAVFGDRLPPVSSSKGHLGHTLAASGAIGAVAAVLAIRDGRLPPGAGFDTPDPEIGFEPVRSCRPAAVRLALVDAFGFGGNNAALLFEKPAEGAAAPVAMPAIPAPAPRPPLAVLGLGVVSPAGASPEDVWAAARRGGVEPGLRVTGAPLPDGRAPVLACAEIPADRRLPPARRRRLSRLHEMALTAARDAGRDAAGRGVATRGGDLALLLGTGLGGIQDTVDFLVNRVASDEREPMPARFVHSVHNAPAAQAALDAGARRMNGATVHREIAFETALWQAARLVETGEARGALVGAADELCDWVIAALANWRRWTRAPVAPDPAEADSADPLGPVPGEGAAVAAVGPGGAGDRPRAWVSGIALGRYRRGSLDAAAECRWIEAALARDGHSLSRIDLLLTGATGRVADDVPYAAVAEAFRSRAGRPIPVGAYKHLCGDFCSASAFGFAVATGLVGAEIEPGAVRASPVDGRPVRSVLLLTLGRNGEKAACCITAERP